MFLVNPLLVSHEILRPDFTSKLVHVLAFGTPKFYIAPYDKIKHQLVNLSSNCDVKSGLSRIFSGKNKTKMNKYSNLLSAAVRFKTGCVTNFLVKKKKH